MTEEDLEPWKDMDRILFGTDDPDAVRKGIKRLGQEVAWQNSSLGRYLRSIRRFYKHSFAQMAHEAGVATQVWKAWEYDFETPTKKELTDVAKRLKWSSVRLERVWSLWESASRFRLKRLTTMRPQYLAAKGLASESNIAWNSISKITQAKVASWGRQNGYNFPDDLLDFFSSFESDEERDAWVEEVLGES
tara:strand:+ start:46 stop:618 length:573 start_codon:yes stop_codon:yes gene_type:complete